MYWSVSQFCSFLIEKQSSLARRSMFFRVVPIWMPGEGMFIACNCRYFRNMVAIVLMEKGFQLLLPVRRNNL